MADVRFASPAAKFTTSFAKRGLVAEHGISWVLPKVVGMSRAMDLLLSSRVVPASEAKEMGLVNFVSEGDCLADAVQYARQCGKLCSPAAMAEIKRQVYSVPPTFRQDSEQANELMRRSFAHEDFKEGVASLVQARDPRFAGLRGGLIRDLGKR
jgi:enoyl-CoA hydratase/carnithine racemase